MSKKLRMKMKRTIAGIVMITTIVWLSGVMALVPVAKAATIVDGDVVRNPSAAGMAQFDVYIAKLVGTKKFKRLVLNPQVFASYGHLKWENVKLVTQAEMDSLTTSGLVRVDGDVAQKVYALAPDNDTGAKSWVNVTATQFTTEAAADPDSVYTINSVDAGNYSAVVDITTVAQVTTFLTAGTLPSVVVVPTGSFTAALAADNPAAGTIADGSAYNTMLKVIFTNGTNVDVNVTGITTTRTGFATDSDITGVLVRDSAGARHGNVLTLADAKAALSFASDPIKVGAGKTETASIQINISSTAGDSGSISIGFKVGAAADITASTAVAGTFPLAGGNFSVVNGANSLGAMTVQSVTIGTAQQSTDLGVTAKEIGKFKFSETSSKEAVNLKKIRFYNNGNSTDADLASVELYNTNTGTSLAKVNSTTNKYVTFDLSASPLKFDKGVNKTLSVRADIVNGSTRTAQFIIQNDYDIEVVGNDSLSGILVTEVANASDGNNTTFPSGETSNFNTILIAAGTLTLSKDASSPSGNIGQGQSNITLGAWKLEAKGEDIQLQKAQLDLATGTTTSADFTGTVKLQTAEGATIYSVASSNTALFGTSAQTQLATYYTIKAGTSAVLKIVADTASDATNGETVQAKLGNIYYYKVSSNTYATAEATPVAANTLTISTAALTVAKNTGMGDSTVVSQSGIKLGSYVFQAGSAEAVSVSTINVTMTAGTSITGLSNLKLFKGVTQVGTTIASPAASGSANAFSVGGSLTIAASGGETIDVYGDLSTAASGTFTTSIAASGISANGSPSGTTISSIPAAAVTAQIITAAANGTLTLATDTATPVQAILHADQSGVEVARFKLNGTIEPIKVTKVVLEATNGSGNLQSIALWDGATQIGTTSNLVDGKVTFSGLSFVVPKDGSKTIKVTMGTTSTGTMVSALQVKLAVGLIEALGNSSGVTVYPGAITTAGTVIAVDGTTKLATITVTSTTGFNVGDAVMTFNATDGAVPGIVTSIASAVSMVAATTANLTAATIANRVTKIASGTTTAGTAGQLVKAGTTLATVSSTTGFAVGDVVMTYQTHTSTAQSAILGIVVSVDTATTMGISVQTAYTSGQYAARVTKVANAATTAGTVVAVNSTTKLATITVSSTTGFNVGDAVMTFNAVDGAVPGIVTSIASAVSMVAATTADLTAATIANRVTKIASDTTTAGTVGVLVKAGTTDATVSSNTGFAVGDVVMTYQTHASTAQSAILGIVISTTGSTGLGISVQTAYTTGQFAGRVTKIWSSTGISNPFYAHDVEPTISLTAGSPAGTSSANSAQLVAKFSIKADGTRDLTVKSITLTRGGNIGTRVAAAAQPAVYAGGTSTLLGTGANWNVAGTDSTAAGAVSLITLTTPYTITAGDTVVFDVKVNTSSAQANDTFQVYIDGTAGNFGNVSWYYDAAAPSPGTEPTNSSPATISDSYAIYGGTLNY